MDLGEHETERNACRQRQNESLIDTQACKMPFTQRRKDAKDRKVLRQFLAALSVSAPLR